MRRLLHSLIIAALAIPAPVSAQLLDPAARSVEDSRRVTLGVTVPFGGPTRQEAKPQLELRSTTIRGGESELAATDRDGWLPRRERTTRLGLTLEASPRLTIDGREMAPDDERLGISTAGYVAIGVGVAALVGGLVFLEAVREGNRNSD